MLQMWTVRTHKDRMSNNIRRNKEAFKREEVSEAGSSLGLCQAAPGPNITYEHRRIPPGLFGKPTESVVVLYDKPVNTLLDTGSTVSTISETYYNQYLSELPLQNINTLLDIEYAGGQQLPYKGYIETHLKLTDDSDIHPCVLLVIPDSNYNTKVPLFIGTNILQPIMDFYKEQHGTRFLQSSNLTTPWYLTFRSITLREKELARHNNALCQS